MMMPFAPLSSNGSNPCQGLNVYNQNRGALAPDQYLASVVVVGLFDMLCLLLVLVTQWKKKQLLELEGRKSSITIMHIVALATGFTLFGLRNGNVTIACQSHGSLLILYISLSFTAYIIRALREWNRVEFSKMAIRYDAGINENFEDNMSTSDGGHSAALSADTQSGLLKILLILWSIRHSEDQVHPAISGSINPIKASSKADSEGIARKLRLYSYLEKPRAVFYLFVILFAPGFISLIPVFFSAELYRKQDENGQGCKNCDIFLELWIIITLLGSWYSLILLRCVMRMNGKPDPFQNMQEIKQTMVFCGGIHVIFWILQLADPGDIAYYRVFQWSWLHQSAMMIALFLLGILPLVRIRKQMVHVMHSRIANGSLSLRGSHLSSTSLDNVFSNPEVAEKFERFAETRFASESFRFLVDVASWKGIYSEKAPELVRKKARLLYYRYVFPGSLLEINIDDKAKADARNQILDDKGAMRESIPITAFDEALREIKAMLETGLWREFVYTQQLDLSGARGTQALVSVL
jgi:Regulator of G protein signaling domain